MDMYGHNQQYVLATHMAQMVQQNQQQHQAPIVQVLMFLVNFRTNGRFLILFLNRVWSILSLLTVRPLDLFILESHVALVPSFCGGF